MVTAAVWGHMWRNCDNQAVVSAVHGGYCRISLNAAMPLQAKFDLTLSAAHVPGVEKGPSVSLSRNKLKAFFYLIPQTQANPSPVPKELVNRVAVRENWTSDIWSEWNGRPTLFLCGSLG